MSNIASEAMRNAVTLVKKSADKAEHEFESASTKLQTKASHNIDLFGGHAVSSVADIASEARRICDELYSSCQALIKILDEECRPLLDQNPDASSIREVRDMIQWLNKSSEIENNFTASLNYSSLGDVASVRYFPSLENKMIQSFWESKYDMHPGKNEADREARQIKEKAEKEKNLQRREEIKKRQENNTKKKGSKEEKYKQQYSEWENQVAAVKAERERIIDSLTKTALTQKKSEIEKRYNATLEELNASINDCYIKKNDAEKQIETSKNLGFIQKLGISKTIRELSAEIKNFERKLKKAENERASELASVDQWIIEKKRQIIFDVEQNNPIPTEPKKPRSYAIDQNFASSVGATKAMYCRAILDYMEENKLYTTTELLEEVPELSDLTPQQVVLLLHKLLELIPAPIERVEGRRSNSFRLTD